MFIDAEGNREVLVFVHIPKTAGSSVRHVMASIHEEHQQLVFDGRFPSFISTLDWVVSKRDIDLRLIHGHVPFGVAERIGRQGKYFTFIREPFERFMSDFNFCTHPESGFYEEMRQRHTLTNFIELESPYLRNPQCKWIAGFHPLEDAPDGLELLNLAKINLANKFASFGITEYFDESLLLIASHLKLPVPIYLQSNTSPEGRHTSVTARERQSIEQLNNLDFELYRFGYDLFFKRIDGYSDFQAVLKDFKGLLKLHKGFHSSFVSSETYVPSRDGVFPLHHSLTTTKEFKHVTQFLM